MSEQRRERTSWMSAGVSRICGGTFQDPRDCLNPWTVPPVLHIPLLAYRKRLRASRWRP